MKNILIVFSKDIIRRNIFDTNFWSEFKKYNKGNKITLLVEDEKVSFFKEKVSSDVMVEGFTRVPRTFYEKIVNFLVRTGVESHSVVTYRMRAYSRNQASLISTLVKGFIGKFLAPFAWYQAFVRKLVLKIQTPKRIQEVFENGDFSHVFAPSLIDNEFDVHVAVETKKRKINLIGMVRSWDNLNNHGLLAVIPDKFIFQNTWLVEAAKEFQNINTDILNKDVVGLPHYDAYKNPEKYLMSRDEFFKALGLDTSKKLIFLGGSDFYYSEDALPGILNKAIEEGGIKDAAQVIFRPHPASLFTLEEYGLDELGNVILDPTFVDKSKISFSDTERFINLMHHSDVIINIASTLSIDAAVFNKPAICINFDSKNKKLSHWEKVHRLYDHFDHYEKLVATGGISLPESPDELIEIINKYFDNPLLNEEGRKIAVETFVAAFDGFSGKRLAESVFKDICK